MKKLFALVLTAVLSSFGFYSFAQNINWHNLQPEQKHVITLNANLDNAVTVGIGYGYHLKTRLPVLLNIEYSMPMGNADFDDLKTRIGGQVAINANHDFVTTVKAYGIIRRFENDLARLVN